MPSKKVLVRDNDREEESVKSCTDMVRVEESIEDFLDLMLPSVPNSKLQVCPLWTDKNGNTYYRCKYWKYDQGDILVTRREADSRFVRVERDGVVRKVIDLTRAR